MDRNPDKAPIAEIGEANFEAEALRSKQPALVMFYAPWSQPCQILGPVLNEVATACAESVKVGKVNADDNPDLSLWYEIQSIPTLLYFLDGSLRTKIVGTATKEAILSKVQLVFHGGHSVSTAADANKEKEHRNL